MCAFTEGKGSGSQQYHFLSEGRSWNNLILAVVRAMYLTPSDQNMNAQEQKSRICLLQAHSNRISLPESVNVSDQMDETLDEERKLGRKARPSK